jgi:hypothetical protein
MLSSHPRLRQHQPVDFLKVAQERRVVALGRQPPHNRRVALPQMRLQRAEAPAEEPCGVGHVGGAGDHAQLDQRGQEAWALVARPAADAKRVERVDRLGEAVHAHLPILAAREAARAADEVAEVPNAQQLADLHRHLLRDPIGTQRKLRHSRLGLC